MQLVTTTLPVKNGGAGEIATIWREQIEKLGRDFEGFSASVLGADSQASVVVVNVIWQSASSVRAVEESGRFKEIIGLLSPYLAGPPTRQYFEILGMAPAH